MLIQKIKSAITEAEQVVSLYEEISESDQARKYIRIAYDILNSKEDAVKEAQDLLSEFDSCTKTFEDVQAYFNIDNLKEEQSYARSAINACQDAMVCALEFHKNHFGEAEIGIESLLWNVNDALGRKEFYS